MSPSVHSLSSSLKSEKVDIIFMTGNFFLLWTLGTVGFTVGSFFFGWYSKSFIFKNLFLFHFMFCSTFRLKYSRIISSACVFFSSHLFICCPLFTYTRVHINSYVKFLGIRLCHRKLIGPCNQWEWSVECALIKNKERPYHFSQSTNVKMHMHIIATNRSTFPWHLEYFVLRKTKRLKSF